MHGPTSRSEQPLAEHVSPPQLFDDLALAMAGALLGGDRLVNRRVEVLAERFDWANALSVQHLRELRMNELDPFAVGADVAAGTGVQRALEVVHDAEDRQQQIDDRLVGLFTAFALDALPAIGFTGPSPEESEAWRFALYAPSSGHRLAVAVRCEDRVIPNVLPQPHEKCLLLLGRS